MSAPADPAAVLAKHYSRAAPGTFRIEPVGPAINSRNWLISREAAARFVLKAGGDSGVSALYRDFCRRTRLLPALLPTDAGSACAIDGGTTWRLLEYRTGSSYPGTPAAGAAAGRALAELHLALRSQPGELAFSGRYLPLSEGELAQVAARQPGLVEKLPRWYRELQALEATPGLRRTWVHHDFHPGNVLFQGDSVSAILDMDSIGTDFRMQAVAFAASRFGSAFTDAYDAVDPLDAVEKQVHPAFVKREALRRANWILRESLAGGDAWQGDLAKHLRVLEASA